MGAYSRGGAYCKQLAWAWGLLEGELNRGEGAKFKIHGIGMNIFNMKFHYYHQFLSPQNNIYRILGVSSGIEAPFCKTSLCSTHPSDSTASTGCIQTEIVCQEVS